MCALLAPAVGVTGVGPVEQLPALIPGPNAGLPGITQLKSTADQGYADYLKENDNVSPPVKLSLPRDGMRHLATVGVDKGSTFSANLVTVPNNVTQPDPGDPGDPSQPEGSSGGTSDGLPPVAVPSLVGLPVAEAEQALTAVGLVPDFVFDEEYEEPGKCDVVDSQEPVAGTQVPHGSAVDVYLETVPVVVPDLAGKSVLRAAELLKPDLVLGEVSGKGDVVDRQDPVAGTEVPCGSAVDVYLKSVFVVVPNLVGSSVSRAAELLKPDLVLGEVSGKCGVIDSQDPVAETEVPRGSAVNVYLETVPVPVPNLVSRTVDEARVVLAGAGLVLRNDPAGERRVESHKPAAETLVCPGSAVTVTVSEVSAPPVVPPPVVPPPVVPPPVVPPPVVQPPVDPVAELIPRWWPIPALLALLVAGILVSRAIRAQQEQKGAHTDVRAVVGADPDIDVEVVQSRTDRSTPTCVVRIEPRADSGTQVLEEVRQ